MSAAAPPPASTSAGSAAGARAGLRVTVAARTDVGNEREVNEDNFLVADLSLRTRDLGEDARTVGPKGLVFAICDGMGGAAAGEVASDLGVETLYNSLVTMTVARTEMSRDDFSTALEGATHRAAARIHEDATADSGRAGMGTTLTAAALVDRHVVFAQVGDSRGYLCRAGRLTQITRDQSLVAKLVERGHLQPEDVATFEHGNIILQALGATPTVVVELTYVELARGDRLLLCSDGLHGMVPDDEIERLLGEGADPRSTCEALIERAKELGGHDNVTAIIAFADGEGLPAAADLGDVVVNARGGGTELFPIPDPKNLGELLIGLQGGTAVLGANRPSPVPTDADLEDDVPEEEIPPLPSPPAMPALGATYDDERDVAAAPAAPAADLDDPPPSSLGVAVVAPTSLRARPPTRGSSKRSWLIAVVVLGGALLAFAAVLIAFETRPASKPAAKPAEPNEPSGWTMVDPAASGALTSPAAAAASAAAAPRQEARPRADAQVPIVRPTPAAPASVRRGDLAPIRDEE